MDMRGHVWGDSLTSRMSTILKDGLIRTSQYGAVYLEVSESRSLCPVLSLSEKAHAKPGWAERATPSCKLMEFDMQGASEGRLDGICFV